MLTGRTRTRSYHSGTIAGPHDKTLGGSLEGEALMNATLNGCSTSRGSELNQDVELQPVAHRPQLQLVRQTTVPLTVDLPGTPSSRRSHHWMIAGRADLIRKRFNPQHV